MSEDNEGITGRIAWADLTTPNAAEVRDFYSAVIGWRPQPVDMGGYDDYNMTDPATGEPVTGVCYKRGANRKVPPQWILYFSVPDLAAAAEQVERLGGEILDGPRSGFCIFRDPAGAVAALYQD